jgi:hypothetical protein
MKTLTDLRRLIAQKTWDKDVVLWVGPLHPLRDLLASVGQPVTPSEIDLLDLLPEQSIPDSDEDIGLAIKARLRSELQGLRSSGTLRRVLIVKSAALLTRYSVGLKEFFDWFVGDHAMVVLVLDGVPAAPKFLPSDIELRPDWLLRSLHRPDFAKHVFSAA